MKCGCVSTCRATSLSLKFRTLWQELRSDRTPRLKLLEPKRTKAETRIQIFEDFAKAWNCSFLKPQQRRMKEWKNYSKAFKLKVKNKKLTRICIFRVYFWANQVLGNPQFFKSISIDNSLPFIFLLSGWIFAWATLWLKTLIFEFECGTLLGTWTTNSMLMESFEGLMFLDLYLTYQITNLFCFSNSTTTGW